MILSLPSLRTPGLAKRSARSTGSVTRAIAHFGLLKQPCLAMWGWPILAWCDRHHLLPIRLLVRRTLRELGWPRIPGVQHRHNRWPRRIPPSMVEDVVRRYQPGEEPCSVCADTQTRRSEADQRAAGEIPACSPLSRPFTMRTRGVLSDGRRLPAREISQDACKS